MQKTSDRNTRLRALRGEMSQHEFAESIGLRQQNYACYETGRYLMKSDLIIRICEKYGCSAEWLLGFGPDDASPQVAEPNAKEGMEGMGERIRRLRKYKLCISADALGKMLSKPRTGKTVTMWERGKCVPADDTLAELAEILGVTVQELCGGSGCCEAVVCEEGDGEQQNESSLASNNVMDGLSDEECSLVEDYRLMDGRRRKLFSELAAAMASKD